MNAIQQQRRRVSVFAPPFALSASRHLFLLLALPPSRLSTPPKLATVDFAARSISSSSPLFLPASQTPLFLRRAALPLSLSDPSPLLSSVLWLTPRTFLAKNVSGRLAGKKCPPLCPRFRARSFDHSFIQPLCDAAGVPLKGERGVADGWVFHCIPIQ